MDRAALNALMPHLEDLVTESMREFHTGANDAYLDLEDGEARGLPEDYNVSSSYRAGYEWAVKEHRGGVR